MAVFRALRAGRPWRLMVSASPKGFPWLGVTVGRPLPGNRNDCTAWEPSGVEAVVGQTTVIADGVCGSESHRCRSSRMAIRVDDAAEDTGAQGSAAFELMFGEGLLVGAGR